MATGDFPSGPQPESDKNLAPTTHQPSYGRGYQPSRPLIESARNGWQSQPRTHYHHSASSDDTKTPQWTEMVQSMATAPRFRRYALIYLSLFIFGLIGWRFLISPRIQERTSLLNSLDPNTKTDAVGRFGANAMPQFNDLIQIQKLSPDLVPGDLAGADADSKQKQRLVIVGDVHGCKKECESHDIFNAHTHFQIKADSFK